MGRRKNLFKITVAFNEADIPEAYHCTRETPTPAKQARAPEWFDSTSKECRPPRSLSAPCISLEKDETREDSSSIIQSDQRVSFSSLEIRSYNVVIGDHPCCSQGCSVSLGWEYSETPPLPLEQYERCRRPRRKISEMRMSPEERYQLLLDDHDETDLRRASRKLHRARSCVARIERRMTESFFNGEG
eukprot:CAMPEP_0198148298 /NCGR_PEP_ID=MMETSP1443-20131203/40863_1 /TAXON_ID=186043 /ORGANISM="Entomoneis sp., Strain CCMP2396" /LENGTH=187 /DNA_ID=CAMNT_0043812953 /DNA_START=311 /DNA_END=874 /DNA_ORIENTATION=+